MINDFIANKTNKKKNIIILRTIYTASFKKNVFLSFVTEDQYNGNDSVVWWNDPYILYLAKQ